MEFTYFYSLSAAGWLGGGPAGPLVAGENIIESTTCAAPFSWGEYGDSGDIIAYTNYPPGHSSVSSISKIERVLFYAKKMTTSGADCKIGLVGKPLKTTLYRTQNPTKLYVNSHGYDAYVLMDYATSAAALNKQFDAFTLEPSTTLYSDAYLNTTLDGSTVTLYNTAQTSGYYWQPIPNVSPSSLENNYLNIGDFSATQYVPILLIRTVNCGYGVAEEYKCDFRIVMGVGNFITDGDAPDVVRCNVTTYMYSH